MSTPDFRSLLSKPADEFKPPAPLPQGTYYGILTKFEFGEAKNEKKTPYLRYTIQLTGAGADVDPSEIAEVDFSKRTVTRDYYLTGDSMWRLTALMRDLGYEVEGKTLDTLIPETQNQQVMLSIGHRPNPKDPERPYVDVGDIKAAA